MTLIESKFSEIDHAVQDYFKNVNDYKAPVSLDDCIEFIHNETGLDYNKLYAIENDIEDMIAEYSISEAKQVMEENGYILEKRI